MKKANSTYIPGLILLMLTTISCKEKTAADVTLSASTKANVAYGSDPLQKMDYYLPAGRSSSTTKVLVLIHGGAWAAGDKSEFTAYIDSL